MSFFFSSDYKVRVLRLMCAFSEFGRGNSFSLFKESGKLSGIVELELVRNLGNVQLCGGQQFFRPEQFLL